MRKIIYCLFKKVSYMFKKVKNTQSWLTKLIVNFQLPFYAVDKWDTQTLQSWSQSHNGKFFGLNLICTFVWNTSTSSVYFSPATNNVQVPYDISQCKSSTIFWLESFTTWATKAEVVLQSCHAVFWLQLLLAWVRRSFI
jgi:hypothetical protein